MGPPTTAQRRAYQGAAQAKLSQNIQQSRLQTPMARQSPVAHPGLAHPGLTQQQTVQARKPGTPSKFSPVQVERMKTKSRELFEQAPETQKEEARKWALTSGKVPQEALTQMITKGHDIGLIYYQAMVKEKAAKMLEHKANKDRQLLAQQQQKQLQLQQLQQRGQQGAATVMTPQTVMAWLQAQGLPTKEIIDELHRRQRMQTQLSSGRQAADHLNSMQQAGFNAMNGQSMSSPQGQAALPAYANLIDPTLPSVQQNIQHGRQTPQQAGARRQGQPKQRVRAKQQQHQTALAQLQQQVAATREAFPNTLNGQQNVSRQMLSTPASQQESFQYSPAPQESFQYSLPGMSGQAQQPQHLAPIPEMLAKGSTTSNGQLQTQIRPSVSAPQESFHYQYDNTGGQAGQQMGAAPQAHGINARNSTQTPAQQGRSTMPTSTTNHNPSFQDIHPGYQHILNGWKPASPVIATPSSQPIDLEADDDESFQYSLPPNNASSQGQVMGTQQSEHGSSSIRSTPVTHTGIDTGEHGDISSQQNRPQYTQVFPPKKSVPLWQRRMSANNQAAATRRANGAAAQKTTPAPTQASSQSQAPPSSQSQACNWAWGMTAKEKDAFEELAAEGLRRYQAASPEKQAEMDRNKTKIPQAVNVPDEEELDLAAMLEAELGMEASSETQPASQTEESDEYFDPFGPTEEEQQEALEAEQKAKAEEAEKAAQKAKADEAKAAAAAAAAAEKKQLDEEMAELFGEEDDCEDIEMSDEQSTPAQEEAPTAPAEVQTTTTATTTSPAGTTIRLPGMVNPLFMTGIGVPELDEFFKSKDKSNLANSPAVNSTAATAASAPIPQTNDVNNPTDKAEAEKSDHRSESESESEEPTSRGLWSRESTPVEKTPEADRGNSSTSTPSSSNEPVTPPNTTIANSAGEATERVGGAEAERNMWEGGMGKSLSTEPQNWGEVMDFDLA